MAASPIRARTIRANDLDFGILEGGTAAGPLALCLHGADDGCIAAGLARRAGPLLAPGSRVVVIERAGHFLHLEQQAEIREHILGWIG